MKKIIGVMSFIFFTLINLFAGELNNYADLVQYQIILIGESHGIAKSYDIEFEIFEYLYRTQNVRDLFIETGYCSTQLLNRYIKTGKSMYLNTVFSNLQGTSNCNIEYYNFFIKIRERCPETILYGVDVEHQWSSSGIKYLMLLLSEHERIEGIPYWSMPGTFDDFINYYDNNQEKYLSLGNDLGYFVRGIESVKQGIKYTTDGEENSRTKYREETMVLNFEFEYSKLEKRKILGIFGGAHTGLNEDIYIGNYPSMAKNLRNKHGNIIASIDLAYENCMIMNTNFWLGNNTENKNHRSNQNVQFYITIQNSPAAIHWKF